MKMKNKIAGIVIIVIGLTLSGCTAGRAIKTESAGQFEQAIMENHVQLVDVRTPEEYCTGHIAYAVNIDVKQPDFKDKALRKLDRKQRTYVYCKTGIRGMRAARILKKEGFKVVNLDRGLQEWVQSGHPLDK